MPSLQDFINVVQSNKTLNRALTTFYKIPTIHNGGCGIEAYVLYKLFEKEGFKPEVIFMHRDERDRSCRQNRRALKENNLSNATSCAHVCLKVAGFYLDSQDIDHFTPYCYTIQYAVPIEFLEAAICNRSAWNPIFVREKWVPHIQKRLGVDLSFALEEW